jgi:hypothetical protein
MTNGGGMGEWGNGVLWEIFKNLLYVLNINKSSLGFVVVKFESIKSVPATQQKILISISSFSRKYPINGIGIEFFVFQNKSHFCRGIGEVYLSFFTKMGFNFLHI